MTQTDTDSIRRPAVTLVAARKPARHSAARSSVRAAGPWPILASAALLFAACRAGAQSIVVNADHPDGIYQSGESVHWTVVWKGPGDPPASFDYTLKKGGLTEIGKGTGTFAPNAPTIDAKFDAPGTLLLDVRARPTSDARPIRGNGGAIASARKIEPSAKKPADFDAFWAAKLQELASVPAEPKLEPWDAGKPGVSYWKITMNNIRGTHIQGQVARPAEGARFPALLIVQWAGVYPLQKGWVTDRAKEGWLALNIEAHDIPIEQPPAYYADLNAGALKNYPAIGNEDRETSYFLRMYLSCYRAAQYLSERPDWDGKTLVVMGGSQGGLQTLLTAAIHPKITAALAEVPAGCDMLGPDVGRAPGWPMWYWGVQGKDAKRVREASRYYDIVNFTSRIKCPVLVGAGLIDETCPPAGVLAAFNQIRAPKEIVLFPHGGHQDEHGSHALYTQRCWGAWMPALRQGKPAPVEPSAALAAR
ncbi:MAG TPA: acetylxylan esterase [Chthonomonadaceae bacterium]|nr:acetylxylan esterase [Chthonomonadaceae bacterium]